jgi:hypothetical protein
MEQKKNDRNRVRRYRRMTFGQIKKRWMKISVGRRRGTLKAGIDQLERALNLTSFDMAARLEIIGALMGKRELTSATKSRIKNHCREMRKEADFLQKAGLYLLDMKRH